MKCELSLTLSESVRPDMRAAARTVSYLLQFISVLVLKTVGRQNGKGQGDCIFHCEANVDRALSTINITISLGIPEW